MSATSPSDARARTISTPTDPDSNRPFEAHLIAPTPGRYTTGRDPSQTRGRAASATSPQHVSPRVFPPATQAPPKQTQDSDVERRPAPPYGYGHHRQTSIVNGVQHSRNTSAMSTADSTPLSPEKIMASGLLDGATQSPGADLTKSPSLSTIYVNGTNSAALPVNRSFDNNAFQRRPEHMHSGKAKRPPEHQHAHSKNQVQPAHELTTVGEYALHHLFTSFIAEAEERIERCIAKPGEREPRVENVCGPGADPAFDQLISSLGHINRHKPKSLIDPVIHWRKKKAEIANSLMSELQTARESVPLTQQHVPNGSFSSATTPLGGQDVLLMEHNVHMAERKSAVSIYILCRVLIEVIGQTTLVALNGPDNALNTAGRLEDVIYGQLQNAEPESLATSSLRKANWVIRGQLLGVMSGIRFEEVANRFTRDLEKAHSRLSVKTTADPRLAAKTAILVQSMRWLKVRTQPEDAWAHACSMLQLLTKFFVEVHGRMMKHAYAELFEQLLLPVAGTATSELSAPKWKEVLAVLQPKISQMLPKADHWPHVFPLQAVLFCVSPADQFASQWFPLVASFQSRARDRAGRSHVLKAICRLVWRYLYRFEESQLATVKRLDEVVKLVFQGGKRVLISTDPVIADPLIQLIRIIGFKHQELCFRTIIFPLMNSELFSGPEQQLKIENLDPEKTVIAIRAFLAVMGDLEAGRAPHFPTSFECDALMDPASRSPITHRRTKSQGFAVSAGRTERLSRPVMTSNFNDVTKEYYVKFCKILGQLTIICDNTFGGQAVLDEKIATHTPKTPMAEAFTFNKREDVTNPTDLRQHYYDLFHVAVEALPRCLSPHLPINSLVNLLCTGTAHVQSYIASSSAQSLKSIARQSHAQQVTIGFARFIFNFDDRYATTVSDGSLLGPGHIESTLKLYVELLQIWIEDIQKRRRTVTSEPTDDEPSFRQLPLDMSSILAHVDEVESHGLFFLCSPSRAVRAIAVNVLRLITKFDIVLDKPTVRIIGILEGNPEDAVDVNNERLSLAERSRLQKRKSGVNNTLVELCSSDVAHDAILWLKIFPSIVRLSSQTCLHAVALTRELVCQRLSHSHRMMSMLADGGKQLANAPLEAALSSARQAGRFNSSAPDIIIEQWRIHLIFACTTVTHIGAGQAHTPKSSHGPQHSRKSSKSSSASQEKIASATELFAKVVPFLSVPNGAVRAAAVTGLGSTNATLFQTLLQSLHPYVTECSADAKERVNSHQRNLSSPRRNRRTDILRTEITRLLSLTCHLLKDQSVLEAEFALTSLVDYAKHLRMFLSDTEIQSDLELQKLRTYFCSLIEGLYECTRNLKDSSRWMSFQSRQAVFSLLENWCGFSPNEGQLRQREEHVRQSLLDREQDARRQGIINSAFEKDRIELQNAALSAMAALCAGPLNFVADGRVLMNFDLRRMFSWIGAIFESPSDRTHAIGRRALQNLIVHNEDHPLLMTQAIRMCYVSRNIKALASYFEVITSVLAENENDATPFWKVLCIGLHTLGNDDTQIRMKSASMLRMLEERRLCTSEIQDLEIIVSDKTTAVYKDAQFEVSRRLSKQHPELGFNVLSEFSAHFNDLRPEDQRGMVFAMLPWVQTIELQMEPNDGGPSPTSYMLLVNLFEITVKAGTNLHNEMQAIWQALATGPYAGNVLFILDFVTTVCLEKREQNFVGYAKQVIVFLSKTPAGARMIDHLLLQIHPKTMVIERREPLTPPTEIPGISYIADISLILPSGAKQAGLSLAQLCMIFLVDLIVSPVNLTMDKIPALLQVVCVQWDQNVATVQEHARDMLIHLIHELVISRMPPDSTQTDRKSIEEFIESIRLQDPKIIWSYADKETANGEVGHRAVLASMEYLINEIVKIFSVLDSTVREQWAEVAMEWATTCAVPHVACRSFQIFRCLDMPIDQSMLAGMLARLSSTISDDENPNLVMFSLEILITLRMSIRAFTPDDLYQLPQIFWTICACLDAIFESEFNEGLGMLSLWMDKMDLSDPDVIDSLLENQPERWDAPLHSLHSLIYKGMRSSFSMERSLVILERLVKLPSGEIVGSDDRILFTVLANLPRFLHHFENESADPSCVEAAKTLASASESQKNMNLCKALQGFALSKFRNQKDFLTHCMTSIRMAYFPAHELQSLIFLMGMVNNECAWFKVKTMQVLKVMIADIDMRKPEIASQGPDLISPLLRLLQTQHCQQALDVLDNVLDMTGKPMDNKHLRMSMAGWHSSRATRKEYGSTESLYGIPEQSGWSVPMPAIHSAQTRSNVNAIYMAVTHAWTENPEETTPEIEFENDEYQDSYFGSRGRTYMSDETKVDGNMGELAMKLDSLDDFFDEQEDTLSPIDTSEHPYTNGSIEERQNLYDQQALPILHRSLKRNPSVTSFQTGFNELNYPPREPTVMNPMAFAYNAAAASRPGMHNRSATSPVMLTKRSLPPFQTDLSSMDDTGDEPDSFSDEELGLERAHTTDDTHPTEITVKPAGFKAGFRQGLRRLTSTGGKSEAREALKTSVPAKSPRVPKVPATYLNYPGSAEP